MMGVRPIAGSTEPRWATHRKAATPARRPEIANAVAMTASARMPMSLATEKSCAAARMLMPSVVRRRKRVRRPSETSTITIARSWIRPTPTPNTGITWLSSGGSWIPRGRGEMTFWKVTWRIPETAKLVRSIVAMFAPRTGRNAIRSISRAAAIVVATAARKTRGSGAPNWMVTNHMA